MKKISKRFKATILALLISVFYGPRANAFTDGSGWAAVSYLASILAESIKQYYQLKTIIEDSQRNYDYIRMINSGLDSSIGMLEGLPIKDEKLLSDLKNFRDAVGKVSDL